MKTICINYVIGLLLACCTCLPANGYSSRTPVAVILAPDAPASLSSAAGDLLVSLKKVFPDEKFVLTNDAGTKQRRIEIVIDGRGTFESFRITRTDNGGLRISGADALGTVYGVYALLEYYGCGFYLTYDTHPAPEKGAWRLPDRDFEDAPIARERYSFNWHNFLSGCSGWDLAQWKSWIDQCRKLRYNVVMVHAYGNNPMFTFKYRGIIKPAGVMASTHLGRDWGTPHVNDVRRMIGGEHFPEAAFSAPEGLLSAEEQIEAVQGLMKKVFAHAKSQGMKIAFQIDVDTDSNNPAEMMNVLPETAKIKTSGNRFRPNPDTPEGREFYTVIVNELFKLYPEISSLVACTRIDPVPGYRLSNFPEQWQEEMKVLKRENTANENRLAAYFWVGKVVSAFQDILKETGRGNVAVAQASWQFDAWLPYADACSPKTVSLLALDYAVVHDKAEFNSPEGIRLLRDLSSSGRRVVPVIWSHHDDGHYLGRTYTPYSNFASRLEEAGCDSYGIIHWTLRPHGLYFKSHSVQT
jgi:hypothetical protein